MSSRWAPRIRWKTRPGLARLSARCAASSIPESSWQFRLCKMLLCHAVRSARATTRDQDCEMPRLLSVDGLPEDKSSLPLHRSEDNPLRLPSTPQSTPELQNRPAPFESTPTDSPPVSFFQTCLLASTRQL